jgi:peptidoglycan hydrolase-like protein with peptidoglycan-binding domain
MGAAVPGRFSAEPSVREERLRLRKAITVAAAALSCSAGLAAATTQQNKKSTQAKTAAAPAPAAKKTATPRGTAQKPAVRSAHAPRATHPAQKAPGRSSSGWHPGQTAPTPDRYKEIQEALVKKGYLHGEANGVWNQDSADALRRFQQDQNLQADGKLDSLSIIALGLGPKY